MNIEHQIYTRMEAVKTNGQIILWYLNILKEGSVTESEIKREAIIFFGERLACVNKQTIVRKLNFLKKEHENVIRKTQRLVQKAKNGSGKGFCVPPVNFMQHMDDEKKKRAAFAKICKDEVEHHEEFLLWKQKIASIFSHEKSDTSSNPNKINESNVVKLVRQNSTGSNIYDTEKRIPVERSDGATKNVVVKETYAKITIRKRKGEEGDDSSILGETHRKRTKVVDNILNHVNEKSKIDKAKMISKIIDNEGPDFGRNVKVSSKILQENDSLSVAETNALQVGTRSSAFLWRQTRTAFKKTLGFSPLASAKKVDQFRAENLIIEKSDWLFVKKNLYKYKQGKNRAKPEETPVIMVKDLRQYIIKVAESEADDLDLTMGKLPVCFDADAGGGRFVASFAFLNRKDSTIVLHPFLLYEGSDNRKNLEMTLGVYTETIRSMEGDTLAINDENVKLTLYGLFDLAALNTIIGKQNHSSTYPCAWTNVSKDHLKSENHKHKYHTENDCDEVEFLSLEDYANFLTKHAFKTKKTELAKTGKHFGSVVAHNLMPFENILRYIPPLMHIIMGEANNILKELKQATIDADNSSPNVQGNSQCQKVQEELKQMYDEKETLEADWNNLNFSEMVLLTDIQRLNHLNQGNTKEASKCVTEIFDKFKRGSNPKLQCDAEICLLFANDVRAELDAKLTCINTCEVHVRCEGYALLAEATEIPGDFQCRKCRKAQTSTCPLEKTLLETKSFLANKKYTLNQMITLKTAEIDVHENLEAECSGPRQRQLKEALKALGDVARYHGGDLQGKQVQKLLDNARNDAKYELLECISDKRGLHEKLKSNQNTGRCK